MFVIDFSNFCQYVILNIPFKTDENFLSMPLPFSFILSVLESTLISRIEKSRNKGF